MATQLGLYNSALRFLGETKLLSLTEDREARYALDDVWADNLIKYVLEQGYWYFAMRAAQFNSDPTLVPPFGMAKGFEKPSDWVRTNAICSDPFFNVPITAFSDESGFWFCDSDPIYARFVSNDPVYGGNLAIWPESFTEFAAAHMAWRISPKLTTAEEKVVGMEKARHKCLIEARSKAAMNESAVFPPQGTWTRSRIGRSAGGFDRGSRNSLIG
jgi:hypothetical protein